MSEKDIIDEFIKIVEEAREESWYEYYDTLRNTLDLIKKLQQELQAEKEKNKEIKEIARNNPPKTIIFPTTIMNEEGDLEGIDIKYTLLEGNYIDKWIIEDKIEELEKLRETLTDSNGMIEISSLIDTLQELLEE